MQVNARNTLSPARGQTRRTVTAALGCEPRQTPRGMTWEPQDKGILSAVLRPGPGERLELDVVLAAIPETAQVSMRSVWGLVSEMIKETDLTAVPIGPLRDGADRRWQIVARLTLRDAELDLPRLNRLTSALELLDRCAQTMQAALPVCRAQPPEIPPQLKGAVEPLTAQLNDDSDVGNVCRIALPRLQSGITIAFVGNPLRCRLELDRLARTAPNIAVLQQPTPIQRVPQLSRLAKVAGLIIASPCPLLTPRMSLYELGRELEAMLQELAANALGLLTYGSREELESLFGVGQGRAHSPLLPVVETLPAAEPADLVRIGLAASCQGLAPGEVDRLVRLILKTVDQHAPEKGDLLYQPLANLAAQRGPSDPNLSAALGHLAADLTSRRDTFGTCAEAPATPRPPDTASQLMHKLAGEDLEQLLRSKILGQDAAISELCKRIWQEAICRPPAEPLRLMLAGGVGTGKSVACKYVAEILDWPYHYIDAASFDSEHAVMSSLAGVSPGIVNSHSDGVLGKIARRPSVVEIADLDHARAGVRGALCEFFLRILQEGSMQTGSGMIIRTIPSVIFIFTSNIAYGTTDRANSRFGFGNLTRDEVRQRVESRALEDLGHAFISRVGEPILFDEFTHLTAAKVAEMEIEALVARVTGIATVVTHPGVSAQIVSSLPTLETGARGVIDAARAAVAESLRSLPDIQGDRVVVRMVGQKIVVESDVDQPAAESANSIVDINAESQALL